MKTKDANNNNSLAKVIIIAVAVCFVVVFVGIIVSYLIASHFDSDERSLIETRGLFGDSWGGVNALVSALAFAGVIVTLYLQNRDLNLQREEMQLQRKEFEEENKTIKYQRFENLFYNMLNLQQKIVDGLRYEYNDNEYTWNAYRAGSDRRTVKRDIVGRDVFRFLFENAHVSFERRGYRGFQGYLSEVGLGKYDETEIPSYFDHYFRHLYKIVQFVDSQDFDFNESYKYVSFLRGTLSRYELVWIYYNTLNPDYFKFKLLIEKYSLLKALRRDLLTESKESLIICNGLGLKKEDLERHNIQLDFANYLTDNPDETDKYLISAFWNKKEISEGLDYLAKWRNLVATRATSLNN